jgi:hypothetical protein
MTKTISTVTRLVAAIDWRAVGDRLDRALELAWTIAQLLLTAAVLLSEVIWEHRAHIRQALVTAIAATFVAGQWTRQQLDRLSRRSAALLLRQPIVALAPITATVQAAREALERLIARLYPVAPA